MTLRPGSKPDQSILDGLLTLDCALTAWQKLGGLEMKFCTPPSWDSLQVETIRESYILMNNKAENYLSSQQGPQHTEGLSV